MSGRIGSILPSWAVGIAALISKIVESPKPLQLPSGPQSMGAPAPVLSTTTARPVAVFRNLGAVLRRELFLSSSADLILQDPRGRTFRDVLTQVGQACLKSRLGLVESAAKREHAYLSASMITIDLPLVGNGNLSVMVQSSVMQLGADGTLDGPLVVKFTYRGPEGKKCFDIFRAYAKEHRVIFSGNMRESAFRSGDPHEEYLEVFVPQDSPYAKSSFSAGHQIPTQADPTSGAWLNVGIGPIGRRADLIEGKGVAKAFQDHVLELTRNILVSLAEAERSRSV